MMLDRFLAAVAFTDARACLSHKGFSKSSAYRYLFRNKVSEISFLDSGDMEESARISEQDNPVKVS